MNDNSCRNDFFYFREIYPCLTSYDKNILCDNIAQARELGVKSVCYFPTMLASCVERLFFRNLIDESGIETMPMVHLRGDMSKSEIDYLHKRYSVRAFVARRKDVKDLGEGILKEYGNMIFIENGRETFAPSELLEYGGLCLDFTRLYELGLLGFHSPKNPRRKEDKKSYVRLVKQLNSRMFKIGSSIIKFVRKSAHRDGFGTWHYASYCVQENKEMNLSEFDYIRAYAKLMPKINSLEIEAPLAIQLQAIDYIKSLLDPKLKKNIR